uniref:Uncharacterized protein n=1 Tax=Acrobeloides nanus TaxID=290746 RepID=A0A914EH60_9BILA
MRFLIHLSFFQFTIILIFTFQGFGFFTHGFKFYLTIYLSFLILIPFYFKDHVHAFFFNGVSICQAESVILSFKCCNHTIFLFAL